MAQCAYYEQNHEWKIIECVLCWARSSQSANRYPCGLGKWVCRCEKAWAPCISVPRSIVCVGPPSQLPSEPFASGVGDEDLVILESAPVPMLQDNSNPLMLLPVHTGNTQSSSTWAVGAKSNVWGKIFEVWRVEYTPGTCPPPAARRESASANGLTKALTDVERAGEAKPSR